MHLTRERKAELMIIVSIIFFGLFPIFASNTTKTIPPILFAGISSLIAALGLLPYLIATKRINGGNIFSHWKLLTQVTFLNVVIPFIFIFVGASKTSAINTTMLHATEIVFTLFFARLLFGERLTRAMIFGTVLVFFGAMIILYRSGLSVNKGDLLILAGVAIYPLGNHFMKKLLFKMDTSLLLFLRSLFGGIILAIISVIFENIGVDLPNLLANNWLVLAINGLIVLGIAKIFWFEGYKYLPMSKAIGLITAEPAISLLYAYIILREIPTGMQWLGVAVTMGGIYFLMAGKKISSKA